MLNSNYTCTLYDTTTMARFTINFGTTPLAGTTNVQQPTCAMATSGLITAVGNNSGPWDYVWKNSSNTVIKTSLNKNSTDSVGNLGNGNYTVKINTVGQCDNFTQTLIINNYYTPTALFSTNVDTTYLSLFGLINTTNNTTNGSTYTWDFGDGSGLLTSFNPSHNYSTAGIYTISLLAQSSGGCTDSVTKSIVVVNNLTGISSYVGKDNEISIYKTQSSNIYSLKFNLTTPQDVLINMYNMNGQILNTESLRDVEKLDYLVDISSKAQGVYLIQIYTKGLGMKNFKLMRE
jgi:PKD repeat protein